MSKLDGFVGQSYTSQSVSYDCQRTINLFPELDESQLGKERQVAALISVPGFNLAASLPRSPIRAIYSTINNYIYVVAGNGVYNITTIDGIAFSFNLIAELTTTSGSVCIVDGISNYYAGSLNTAQVNSVIIVDGSSNGITFQEGTDNIIQLNVGNNFISSSFVTFQDGIFIFTVNPQGPSCFFASDPLNISLLDEVTNNAGADNISRVISDHDVLWFFGNNSCSIWQNTGQTSNLFQEIPGSYSEAGCNAPHTIQKISGQLIWLASDPRGYGQIYAKEGYSGTRMSTHALEYQIYSLPYNKVIDLSSATSWTYQLNGHPFYCINLPNSNTTWCFDISTKMWSERAYFSSGSYSRDLIETHYACHVPGVGNIHLCGDYSNGNLYYLDNNNFTHNGQPIKRMRTAPHSSNKLERVFYSQLQLDMETGTGLDGQGLKYQQGTIGSPVLNTATDVYLTGNGPSYTFVGNDGSTVLPTNTPTITATGTWSNLYQIANSSFTPLPTNFTSPTSTFGYGNGLTTNYTLSNLPYTSSLVSASVYANDWRGNNLQSTTPITNLCTYSQNFDITTGTWTYTGCSSIPSAWNTGIPFVNVFRPTANTTSVAYTASVTNPGYAYDSTYKTTKLTGTSAVFSATTTNTGGNNGYCTLILKSWGSQTNVAGNLYLSINSSILSPYDINSPASVYIMHSFDGGTTWINDIFNYQVPLSSSVPIVLQFNGNTGPYGNTGLTYGPLPVIPNMSLFQIKIEFYSGNDAASQTYTANLFDVVLINSTSNIQTSIDAPDGTNTGTILYEDISTGQHSIVCNYPSTSGSSVNASVYYQASDVARSLNLALISHPLLFAGSITGSTLTVTNLPIGGSLAIGQTITGPTLLPGTTILSGSGTSWTLSKAAPNPIATESLSAFTYTAYSTFNADGTYSSSKGTANIVTISPGIYRCEVFGTETYTGNNQAGVFIDNPASDYNNFYTGDGNSYIGIWGFQVQENVTTSPYILTQGSIQSDYYTIDLTTGTIVFNIAPLSGAVLTWNGTINGISPNPVDFMATFQYMEAVPNYTYLGTNPTVSLSYSDDGGHTWSPERAAPCGKLGQYKTRAIWRRLGYSRDRVFRITCDDPIKLTLLSAEIWANPSETNTHV